MAPKNVKRSVSMAQEMHALLRQLAAMRGVSESDLIREAIRQFLEEQSDVVSSRRHFQKSLQDLLDKMEGTLTFHLHILIYLLSAVFGEEGELTLADAIVNAKRDGELLLAQIAAVRDLKDEA
jgi:hypothetical protein